MKVRMARGSAVGASVLCGLLLALALAASPAKAERTLQSEHALNTTFCLKCPPPPPPPPEPPLLPPPDGQIEGACGVAVAPNGDIHVSAYYHHMVDVFGLTGDYKSQFPVDPTNSTCGLAFNSSGALYANQFHGAVLRLKPTLATIDPGPATGVSVDPVTNRIYVDKRNHIAVYETNGEPVLFEGQPLKVGLGSLGDGFGAAAFGGRFWVADAADSTIKAYEPAADVEDPVDEIDGAALPKGKFASLVDASLAVDPTNAHLLVVDNTQPGFTHPKTAVYEFDGSGAFLGQLPGAPVFGEPSGIATTSSGALYVTDGNSEEANAFIYGPFTASLGGSEADSAPPGPLASLRNGQAPPSSSSTSPAKGAKASRSQTELVQKGSVRIAVSGSLAPTRLPRDGVAPITVQIGGRVTALDPEDPPQLRKVRFAFNRAGVLDRRGLPSCGLSDIDPSNTRQALAACREALVGEGLFSAAVRLPEQSPFPSEGKVLAFNGSLKGAPVIFAHIYGRKPVPTSIVLPLRIKQAKGAFGTVLDASMAELTGDWGYVTGLELRLGRKFSFKGKRRSFLSAGCPAPKGFPGALFPLAKTSFSFVGGRTLSATLTRSCKVRG